MRTPTFRATLAAAAVAVGAATVFAAPASADEQMDQQFLAAIAEHGVTTKSDADAIDLAQSMCRKLGNGGDKGIQKALYYIKDNTKFSNDEITTFAGIAAQAYCSDKLKK